MQRHKQCVEDVDGNLFKNVFYNCFRLFYALLLLNGIDFKVLQILKALFWAKATSIVSWKHCFFFFSFFYFECSAILCNRQLLPSLLSFASKSVKEFFLWISWFPFLRWQWFTSRSFVGVWNTSHQNVKWWSERTTNRMVFLN